MSVTSQRGQSMLAYLPALYDNSRVMHDLVQAEGVEFDALRLAHDEIRDQFFVRTATWSLADWEAQLGLPIDSNMTDGQRQDRIMSRLRGFGTCTVVVAKQVAESYKHGLVDVVEDHAGYTVHVLFVDRTGIPSNLADLQAAVRAVIPAHLEIVYQFNFFTWTELDGLTLQWQDVDLNAWTWDDLEVLNDASALVQRVRTLDFTAKVVGSAVANPHVYKYKAGAATFDAPPTFTSEATQFAYSDVRLQDGISSPVTASVNAQYGQGLFTFAVLEDLKRKGAIPQAWTAADLTAHLRSITVSFTGYGSGADPAKVAAFAGASVRYLPDGSQAAPGVPRYWDKNILTVNQSDVETDTTGFGTNNVTVTRSTAASWHGSASLLVQPASNGSGRGCYPALRIAVTAGQPYTFSFYIKQASGGAMVFQPNLEWYDAPSAGSLITISYGPIVTLTSEWQRISVTGVAPAGATHVTPTAYSGAVTTAESWHVDGLQLEQGSAATPWRLGGVGSSIWVEESTTNLPTANQSSVETDTTGFAAWGAGVTLSRDTSLYWHGVASLKAVCDGTVAYQGMQATGLSLTAGQTYTYSVYLKGSGTVQLAFRLGAGAKASGDVITLTSTWTRYTLTLTADTTSSDWRVGFYTISAQAVTVWVDGLQLEQKAYATSWTLGGTTRAAETLTHPTPAAIDSGEFALEFDYTPTSNPAVAGRYPRLWACIIDSSNLFYLTHDPDGRVLVEVKAGGVSVYTSNGSDPVLAIGQKHRIALRLSAGKVSHYVNGVRGLAGEVAYTKPAGALPATCSFGPASTANGVYGPARFSSIARTSTELANTGALQWDANTTALYGWQDTLANSAPTYGVRLGWWNPTAAQWFNAGANAATSPSAITWTPSASDLAYLIAQGGIDATGNLHLLVHPTHPSDGSISSVVYTDYVSLTAQVETVGVITD